MSAKLQPVRGTKDLLVEEAVRHRHIIDVAQRVGTLFGFEEIATPIFEFTEIFARTLGESSDVVNKEMYTFEDRGGDSITLRPEFTAGIARAFISNGLQQNLPLKLFCSGPLFRYERPQKGRQRQFHQVNFECLGIKDPEADVEMISMAQRFLTELGLADDVSLELNSLGDQDSRVSYREALVKYFQDYSSQLSEDSQRRLEENPLRILDSKDEGDKEIIEKAPQISEYFSRETAEFEQAVRDGLRALDIPFNVNERIVRGLDYYCHTVYEFVAQSDDLGSQNTVLAGGRYDQLISNMGGPETPATGFAAGIERLSLMIEAPAKSRHKAAIIAMSEELDKEAIKLAQELRTRGHAVEIIYGGNASKRLKKADKQGVTMALLLGEDELQKDTVMVRDLIGGSQQEFSRDQVTELLADVHLNLEEIDA